MTQPPVGATWDGTVEDVAARLLTGDRSVLTAQANALGAIGALVRSRSLAGWPEKRIELIAKLLDGLDLAEQRLDAEGGDRR
jgi:hypothetical protein